MDRLTLPCRPRTAERELCLPAGDGLPAWSTLPLDAKFPMVPIPKGSITLCTTELCEPKHKVIDFNFDLSDPYCHVISNEYQPLHDPHLRYHFNLPRMKRHLRRNGFITNEGKVICNLKEFNQYRHYLRKIYLLQLARERKEEEERMRSEKKNEYDIEEKIETRGDQVRNRLLEIRTEAKSRVEREIIEKAERLQKRLDEIQHQCNVKENRRLQDQRKRIAKVERNRQEIKERNLNLIRRWKTKEKRHLTRMEELKRLRILKQQQMSNDTWELRKYLQKERILREEEHNQIEGARRLRSLETRDRIVNNQRERLRANLERLRQEAKQAYEEREEKHARRLEKRLALLENQKRRRWNRRGGRHYVSLWRLEETLRQLNIPDIPHRGKQASGQFLQLLNSAMDSAEDMVSDFEDTLSDDEEIKHKAQDIVHSVIEHVQNVYPECLEKQDENKAVRFDNGRTVIPSNRPSVDVGNLRPVSDHVLTPASSPFVLAKHTSEKSLELKVVEDLLLHLVDDLDNDRLSKEELLKLTEYSMDIMKKKSVQGQDEDFSDEVNVDQSPDDLIQFTLKKIHSDVKSGNIDHEDLTHFTASFISKDFKEDYPSSSQSSVIDQFIDDTIEQLVQDNDLMTESPVNDAMLDDWIVSTLKEIIDDVEKGRLPEDVVSQMVSQMSAEMKVDHEEIDKNMLLGPFIERIINDLNNEESTSLYKVVHAMVSSYHNYKLAATESTSEFTNALLQKINEEIQAGNLHESEVNAAALSDVALKLSSATLSSDQLHSFTSQIAIVLEEHDPSLSHTAHRIVDTVLTEAVEHLQKAELNELKKISDIVTSSLQEVSTTCGEETRVTDMEEPPYLKNMSRFVVDTLKLVCKCLDHRGFTESDILDMTQLYSNIVQRDNISPDNCVSREKMLTRHIEELLELIETGKCDETDLESLGRSLISCGKRLVGSTGIASKTSSDTSSVVANDVVSSLMEILQTEIKSDTLDKDSVKELAICILKSKTSQGSAETVKESLSEQRHPSPCDSKLAEDFVRATIDDIVRDMDSRFIDSSVISSMAVSIVSALSLSDSFDPTEQFKSATKRILACLKEDRISRSDAKTIFSVILEQYSSGLIFENRAQDVFRASQATTSDSFLAESLIRETLSKIERDIASGNLSNEDLFSVVESAKENVISRGKVSSDIVNFSLAILQQFMFDLNTGKMSLKSLTPFFEILENDSTVGMKKMSLAEVREKLHAIIGDIRHRRSKSKYIRNIVKGFSKKEMRASKKSSPDERDPITALHHILENVHTDILSNFIRATLGSVISNLCEKEGEQEIPANEIISDYELQNASSTVANKVVQNLLERIENTILSGHPLTSDLELEGLEQQEGSGISGLSISRLSSQEISGMILDTLNNIVSNLRLEKSISREENVASEVNALQTRVSSHLIHDFILEKLQDIVENMQEQIAFEGKISADNKDLRDHDDEIARIKSATDAQTTKLVSESLKSVVSDMALETEKLRNELSVNETTSTLSLEAEAVVIETLHNIIVDTDQDGLKMSKESEEMKDKLLIAMEGIKDSFAECNSDQVHRAISELFRSQVPDLEQRGCVSGEKLDTFIKTSLESIISNIKNGNIKSENVMNAAESSCLTIEESTHGNVETTSSESSLCDVKERPSLSLQKMTEMTAEMLKVKGNLPSTSELNDEKKTESEDSLITQIAREISGIANEALHKTISNIKKEKLSEIELVSLATAIAERNRHMESSESDVTEIRATGSGIDDFIVSVLEKVKHDLETNGLDTNNLPSVTGRIAQMTAFKDNQVDDSLSEVSHVSSEVIIGLVKEVLSKIVCNMSEDGSDIEQSGKKVSKSESMQSGSSGNGSISKHNVNPNAAARRLSARSDKESAGPALKNTSVAKIQSAHKMVSSEDLQHICVKPTVRTESLSKSPLMNMKTHATARSRDMKSSPKVGNHKNVAKGLEKQGECPPIPGPVGERRRTKSRGDTASSAKAMPKTQNCNLEPVPLTKTTGFKRAKTPTPPQPKVIGVPNLGKMVPKPPTTSKAPDQRNKVNDATRPYGRTTQGIMASNKKTTDPVQRRTSAKKVKKNRRINSASIPNTKSPARTIGPGQVKSLCGSHKLLVKINLKENQW